MAHDYIDIGSGHLRLNDFHIWTLRHFMLKELACNSSKSSSIDDVDLNELRSFLESWQWLGPGIIDGGDFNSFATSSSRLDMLRCLLVRTRDRFSAFGEHISLSYLEQHLNTPMACYTVAPPVETFTSILDRMISLVIDAGSDERFDD